MCRCVCVCLLVNVAHEHEHQTKLFFPHSNDGQMNISNRIGAFCMRIYSCVVCQNCEVTFFGSIISIELIQICHVLTDEQLHMRHDYIMEFIFISKLKTNILFLDILPKFLHVLFCVQCHHKIRSIKLCIKHVSS